MELLIIIMKKKYVRGRGERRTLSRQASCIDTFSKLDALFLEKFFRYNLTDYFQDALLSLEDDLAIRKLRSRHLKQLASVAFVAQTPLSTARFAQRVNAFYREGWQADGPGFRHLYGNGLAGEGADVAAGELVVVQVRVRAEIERMENLPLEVYRELESYQQPLPPQGKDEEAVLGRLRGYRHRTITLFLVYYGDINFQVFDKFNYCPRAICFFGHDLLVKIHVFYVSRLALLSKFRQLNRIDSFDYLNDLVFQLYEVRRDKMRAKRAKKSAPRGGPLNGEGKARLAISALKWVAIVSVTGVSLGALFLKYFF